MTTDPDDLRQRFAAAGQEHVFADWERLEPDGRARLASQAAAVDLDLVRELAALLGAGPPPSPQRLEPPELFDLERRRSESALVRQAVQRGEDLLASGRVGFLLVAGGQASRLGYEGPKGTFPIGPVSRRTLFEFHARRLLAARRRFGVATPWYVMTSPANDEATRAFFREHDHFGLDASEVRFFCQATNPALDFEGRILMQAPDRLFLAPNGHGGVLWAMATSGALADARERGLTQLSYFQVDNPLARPADPLFLGLHDAAGAGMSSKVVAKRDADEKVGVLGRIDGCMGCIEYSDLPEDLRQAREPSGELRFRAGNIAVHALRVDFVGELTRGRLELPWHVARKRMSVWREGSQTEVEGAKFEAFVFDALARSGSSVTLEVERAHEFSPVKNARGQDSPQTARRDLCRLFAGWVEARGLALPAPDSEGVVPVEVDPLLAQDEGEFASAEAPAPRVVSEGHLYE